MEIGNKLVKAGDGMKKWAYQSNSSTTQLKGQIIEW